jgi:putative ABC transport system permease protein
MYLHTKTKKIFRDVMSRKARTFLVAASIMIGVFGVVTIVSINDLILRRLHNDIDSNRLPMTRTFVTVQHPDEPVDSAAMLSLLRDPNVIHGVNHVEAQAIYPMFWQKSPDDHIETDYIFAYSASFDDIYFEPLRLEQGLFPKRDQHELAVELRFANKYGLGVGDQIFVSVLGDTEPQLEAWTISGIVFHPYVVYVGDGKGESRIYANYEDAQRIANFTSYNLILTRFDDYSMANGGKNRIQRILRDETNYRPLKTFVEDPHNYFVFDAVDEVANVLNILAVVAMVVSGFLVTNVVNTIVNEQRRHIGVLKSLGATRVDTLLIYAGTAFIYGILGMIPGILCGVVVGGLLAQQVAPLALTYIDGLNGSPLAVGIGIALGLGVPIVASAIPVYMGTRITILEAMTDLGISSTWGRGPLARFVAFALMPTVLRQGLSNIIQKRIRLALTVVTLTLAAAAFMGIFALYIAMNGSVEAAADRVKFQVQIEPSGGQSPSVVSTLIAGLDNVEDVFAAAVVDVELEGITTNDILDSLPDGSNMVEAVGVDPADSPFDFEQLEGEGWGALSPEELATSYTAILSSGLAKEIDKSVGDVIMVSAGGLPPRALEVIGIYEFIDERIYVPLPMLAREIGLLDAAGVAIPNTFFVDLVDENVEENGPVTQSEEADVDAAVASLTETLAAQGIGAETITYASFLDQITSQFNTFAIIFQISSGVMAAVGAIGLLTTLSMTVFERQKEIGVMRSIGATSRIIVVQYLVEGVIIGILSWIIAVPLSIVLARQLVNALGFEGFVFSYPLWVPLLGLFGMILMTMLASIIPSLAAARRTVSDILRYQ